MNLKRWHLQRFAADGWELLPRLTVGREPGMWGYPACSWIGWAWLRWHWQLTWHNGRRLP